MIRTRTLGSILLLATAACGGTSSSDPCDGAASGTACQYAGTGEKGFNASNPTANRLESRLYYPMDIAFGPDDRGYIVDFNNHQIRRVEKDDSLVTVVGTEYEGDGAPAMEDRLPECNPAGYEGDLVALNHPTDAQFGADGKLYISAWHNNKVRVLDPATGMVKTLAGDGYGYAGDDGLACQALFNLPKSIAVTDDGTIYVVDQSNVRIRVITTDGMIRTMGGTGEVGNAGDGGQATDAQFGFESSTTTPRPSGGLLLSKDQHTLYVADSLNNRIRRINLDTGIVDCIAGASAEPGYAGDGGQALAAKFNFPDDLEFGPDGRMYVADRYNNVIRAIDLNTGIVETVVGSGQTCTAADCPTSATALEMPFREPTGIGFDQEGNLYVADTLNNRIVKVTK